MGGADVTSLSMWRLAVRCLLVVVATVGLVIAVLCYPHPLFPYRIQTGRLELHSDTPFDLERAKSVLADVDGRISKSVLDHRNGVHRIFVANTNWRARLVFLWNFGAGGVNYGTFTRNVFIKKSDIDGNAVLTSRGEPVPPPRTLAYFAAHEIGHSLVEEHIGAIANWTLPTWIKEGLCDYIAFGGDVDIDALTVSLRSGDVTLDPQKSGHYALYRLVVAYYLDRRKWTLDQLLGSKIPLLAAKEELLASH